MIPYVFTPEEYCTVLNALLYAQFTEFGDKEKMRELRDKMKELGDDN